MPVFKVNVRAEFNHEYEVEAETQDEAEREALELLKDGKEIIWFELVDYDVLDTEEKE